MTRGRKLLTRSSSGEEFPEQPSDAQVASKEHTHLCIGDAPQADSVSHTRHVHVLDWSAACVLNEPNDEMR